MMYIRFVFLILAVSIQLNAQNYPFVSSTSHLKDPSFAEWITMPGISGNEYGVYYFRKAFSLTNKPDSFLIHVSADNRYRLYVNGKNVGWGPAVGDLQAWNYETLDIAEVLREGENMIAAQVWNWGSDRPARQITHRTAFILQGNSSKEQILNSNRTWRVARDEGYHSLGHSSKSVGGGYIAGPTDSLQAAKHPWGWKELSYNDQGWERADELGKGNHQGLNTWLGTPWLLQERTIPLMEQKPEEVPEVVWIEGLDIAPEELTGNLSVTIPKHTRVKFLLDQKELTMGYPRITVSEGEAAKIKIRYQEALFDEMNRKGNRDEWEQKIMKGYYDVFISDGGRMREFEPLWIRVFRYAEIEIETREEALEVHGFNNLFTAYPLVQKGSFRCNNKMIESIWDISWRTARLCALETYMDCPYYEQLQYIGDTRIQALISLYVAGDDRLMKNAIRQFYHSMQPMGLTKSSHPSHGVQIIPPFSLLYINMVYDYFMLGEDGDFVKEFLPGIRFILDWFISRLDETGMTGPLPFWNHVDGGTLEFKAGSPPGIEEGGSAHMSVLLAYTLAHAAEIFEYYGSQHDAAEYREIASAALKATLEYCYDEGKGLIAETPEKKLFTQHTNAMAILAKAFSGTQEKEVARKILEEDDLAQATLYFNFYVFQALKKAGMGEAIFGALNKWEEFVDLGFTTFPEHGVNSRSDCHAWSSHPMYNFLDITCGISSLEPGFQKVLIEPQLGELTFVEGSVTHPSGEIRTRYEKESGEKWNCTIDMPEGITGILIWKGKPYPLATGSNTFELE
jgi:hypothetical protein